MRLGGRQRLDTPSNVPRLTPAALALLLQVLHKTRPGSSRAEVLSKIRKEVETWSRCQTSRNVARLIETYEDSEKVYLVQVRMARARRWQRCPVLPAGRRDGWLEGPRH